MAIGKKRPNKNLLGRLPLGANMASNNAASTNVTWQYRRPTEKDYKNWFVGAEWINMATYTDVTDPEVWKLLGKKDGKARWVQLTGGGGGIGDCLVTLTGDIGGAVPGNAAHNINIVSAVAGLEFTGNPATNTMTLNIPGGGGGGGLLLSLSGDAGTNVYPDIDGNIGIEGSPDLISVTEDAADNKLTIGLDGGVVKYINVDDGQISGDGNLIGINGVDGIEVRLVDDSSIEIGSTTGYGFVTSLSPDMEAPVFPNVMGDINIVGVDGITVSRGDTDNSIFISGSGGGGELFPWTLVDGTACDMNPNNGYTSNDDSLVTLTLPVYVDYGDIFRVSGYGSGGWKIAQQDYQQIHSPASSTTVGTGGSVASANRYDAIEIQYVGRTDGGQPLPFSVKKIAGGKYHAMLLTTDGELYAAGRNTYGQLGIGSNIDSNVFKRCVGHGASGVDDVICSYYSTYIIKGGAAYACGANNSGGLGVGDTANKNVFTPCINAGSSGVDALVCSYMRVGMISPPIFAFILKSGALYGTGGNYYGTLGIGNNVDKTQFTACVGHGASGVEKVCVNDYATYILKGGAVYACGSNYYGSLGIGNTTNKNVFTECVGHAASGVDDIFGVSANSTAIIRKGGALYGVGNTHYGEIGLGTKGTTYTSFTPCIGAGTSGFTKIPSVDNMDIELWTTLACLKGGALYYSGYIPWAVPNPCLEFKAYTGALSSGVTDFTISMKAHVGLVGDAIYGVGYNRIFGAGEGSSTVPTKSLGAGASGVTKLFNGGYHNTFILSGGQLYASGYNTYGQLGIGSNDFQNTYALVPGFSAPTQGTIDHFIVLSKEGAPTFT